MLQSTLIFMVQLPELIDVTWYVYAMTACLGIIYLFPYITRTVPSPLVAIVVLTTVAIVFGLDIRTVGDIGQLPDSLPIFLLLMVVFIGGWVARIPIAGLPGHDLRLARLLHFPASRHHSVLRAVQRSRCQSYTRHTIQEAATRCVEGAGEEA